MRFSNTCKGQIVTTATWAVAPMGNPRRRNEGGIEGKGRGRGMTIRKGRGSGRNDPSSGMEP